jgi:hypothetical protein
MDTTSTIRIGMHLACTKGNEIPDSLSSTEEAIRNIDFVDMKMTGKNEQLCLFF